MAAYGAELISVPPVRLYAPSLTPARDRCPDAGAATLACSLPTFFAAYDALPLRHARQCLQPKDHLARQGRTSNLYCVLAASSDVHL
jgi:hypothetical protein